MFQQGRPNTGRMLGYRLEDGKLHIIPEEAALVRQIFTDYLSGMGVLAISKKLNVAGVPTRNGGPWTQQTVRKILRNDKYTGSLILQKTFRQDHISKKTRINRGELPKYHIEGSHEAIIPREMFDAVQDEFSRRAAKFYPKKTATTEFPFTGRIVCDKCGHHYRRKHTAIGTRYEKIVWICSTFNTSGKFACNSQQIPESILQAKIAETLGLSAFDESVFAAQISEIRVPEHNKLVFVFRDGRRVEADWHNPSRRESWTQEMKQAARERQLKILEERRRLSD